MGGTGLELPQQNPGNLAISSQGGAQSGARSAGAAEGLQEVVTVWPCLSDDARAEVLRIIRGARRAHSSGGRQAVPE